MSDKEIPASARMGYLFTVAILLFAILSRIMILRLIFEWFLGIVTLLILLFINLLMLALHPREPPRMIHLIPLSLIVVLVFWHLTFISYFFVSYSTDSIVMSHMGAEMVLQGKNPYKGSLFPYLERFNVPYPFMTPKMDGTLTDIITYPAFNFLVFVPFLALGVTDLRWVLLLFHIATLMAIYVFSPAKLRPIVLIPMFMIPGFLDFTPGAVTDMIWVFFLVLSLRFWYSKTRYIHILKAWFERFSMLKNRSINLNTILSGIFLGLAMSFKQITWIALPFFLIRLWHENFRLSYSQRLRKLLSFCMVTALPFIIFNVPFIVDSPGDWLAAVAAPLFPLGAPMAPYGIGISSMTLFGVSLPKSYFINLTLLAISMTIVTYYLYHDRLRFSMWAFLIVIPLFWWRSLPNYCIYWIPPMVLDIARNGMENERISLPNFLMRNRKKIIVSLLMLSVFLAFFIHTSSLSSPEVLSIEFLNVTLIQEEDIDAINRLNVSIRNIGLHPIIPRFGVSWRYVASNLIYWNILDGPETLFPGDIATYHISTEVPEWFLKNGDVVSLVVNDERNPNVLKVSSPITVDIPKSGKILNGLFHYWTTIYGSGLKVPYQWVLLTKASAGDDFFVSNPIVEGRRSLMIQVYQDGHKGGGMSFGKIVEEEEWAHAGLIQEVSVLRQIGLYVFPTFNSTPGIVECGIRISDGESRHFVVLFSDIPNERYLYHAYPNLQQLILILPTKLNQWNYYAIDVVGNWTYLEWDLPRQFYVEFYVATQYTESGNYRAYFAEISSESGEVDDAIP